MAWLSCYMLPLTVFALLFQFISTVFGDNIMIFFKSITPNFGNKKEEPINEEKEKQKEEKVNW